LLFDDRIFVFLLLEVCFVLLDASIFGGQRGKKKMISGVLILVWLKEVKMLLDFFSVSVLL
jgi:hypothetical protein